MLKDDYLKCPACKKKNEKNFFITSRKTFNSLPGYKYLKCENCFSIYLSDKNLTNKKLTNIHSKYWILKKKFQFKRKKIPKKQIKEWELKLKNLTKGKKIALDIGCGKGIISHALSKLGLKKIFAFDVNLSETYNMNEKKISFFNSNFENFDKKKEIKNNN